MTPFLQGQWVNTGIYLDLRHAGSPWYHHCWPSAKSGHTSAWLLCLWGTQPDPTGMTHSTVAMLLSPLWDRSLFLPAEWE